MTIIDCPWVGGEWEPLDTVELSNLSASEALDRMRELTGRPTAAEQEQQREARETAERRDTPPAGAVVMDEHGNVIQELPDEADPAGKVWPD